jgi:TatD DNase family protein
MTGLVDTHAHLMDQAFHSDHAEVLARTRQAGVEAIVLIGYDLPSSRAAVEMARPITWAVATVGIHPNAVSVAREDDFAEIARLAKDPIVAGIGETGLDYFRDRTPPARQREAFEWHLRLAEERSLPVVVHTRDAHADVAEMLEASAVRRSGGQVPGVLHCFTGSIDFAERMQRAGYYLSFAGPLTYKNDGGLREVAACARADRLLVETDCPYLPPASRRGQRNEPAFVMETARVLAEVRGVSADKLADQLWDNSLRVFPTLAQVAQVAT